VSAPAAGGSRAPKKAGASKAKGDHGPPLGADAEATEVSGSGGGERRTAATPYQTEEGQEPKEEKDL
jgi:hypothetical protein